MNKKCNHCEQVKNIAEFGKWKYGKDGLRGCCNVCKRKQYKSYKEHNREYALNYYRYTARGRYIRFKANIRHNPRRAEIPFNITADEFIKWWEEQVKVCYYCGQHLTIGESREQKLTDLTIDRKDNNKGYTVSNIALSCSRCNTMKGSWLTEEQTKEIGQRYFGNLPKK